MVAKESRGDNSSVLGYDLGLTTYNHQKDPSLPENFLIINDIHEYLQ